MCYAWIMCAWRCTWVPHPADAKAMRDQPYTLVVTDQGVQERLLGTCGTEVALSYDPHQPSRPSA